MEVNGWLLAGWLVGWLVSYEYFIRSLVRYHRHVYLEMEAASLFDTMVIVC
jgi:hypothetical protein